VIESYLPPDQGLPDASLVAINNQTGGVISMFGGYNYDTTQFNTATQAERQPGSAWKVFDLAKALEEGVSPNTEFPSKIWTAYVKGFPPFKDPQRRGRLRRPAHARGGSHLLRQHRLRPRRHRRRAEERRQLRARLRHHDRRLGQSVDDDRRPLHRRDTDRHGARLLDDRARRRAGQRVARIGGLCGHGAAARPPDRAGKIRL
jgi:hypothetical protein